MQTLIVNQKLLDNADKRIVKMVSPSIDLIRLGDCELVSSQTGKVIEGLVVSMELEELCAVPEEALLDEGFTYPQDLIDLSKSRGISLTLEDDVAILTIEV